MSDLLYPHPRLFLALLLGPPLLWLGVVYVGSLLALLAQSFFRLDEFTGLIVYEPTLATYAELLAPSNLDIILRTVAMAALVTDRGGDHRLPDRLFRRALCARALEGLLLSRRSCCRSGRAIWSASTPGS